MLADVHRPCARRAWRIRPQSFRERGLTDARLGLGKHADAGESAQQPAQGRGIGAGRFRQFLDSLGPIRDEIGNAKCRRHVDGLGDPEAIRHREHGIPWRLFIHMGFAPPGVYPVGR